MNIIAIAEALTTIGWGLITNFISKQVEDPVIAQLTQGKRLENHDLARALHLAFLQALEKIADELMKHGAMSHEETVLLKQRVSTLAEERRSLGQVENVAPPLENAEAIALLVIPTRPEVAAAQQELSARLVALATPTGTELPGKYRDRLHGQLFEWMGRYFMMQVKYEPVVFHALTTETNALILHNQVEMKRLLQQLYQRLVPPEPSTCKSVPVELKSVHFVERPEVEDAISAGFDRQNPILLCGLGGAGKTQVAGWYARAHWGRYRYILWLHAEEEAILASEYAALATRLQLPAAGLAKQADVISAVHGWFEQATDWLLIFDNATGPEAIARYLPGNPRGHVLITSRNQEWEGAAERVVIAPFRPEESVAYLLAVTGEQDAAAAAALAGELGHLPLALAQAGAYIARSGLTTLAGYLGRYRSARLLNKSKVRGYKETVATTWAVSFATVEQQAPAARDFMRFCAFLAPDAIPVEIFELGGDALPPGVRAPAGDPDELDRMIGLLRQYSLLSVEPQSRTLSVHRLVQEAVRDGLGDDWPLWARATVTVLTALFPDSTDEPASWPRCRQYLSHAQVSLNHLREHELTEDRSSNLRNRLGLYLREVGSYEPSLRHLARSLQVRTSVYGPDHPDVAWCHTYLCRILRSLGRYEEALEHGTQAVAIWQAQGADDEAALATGHTVLGGALHALGRFDQALEQQEKALRIGQDVLGPEHPETAAIHDSLGVTLRALEKYREALWHQQRALAIRKRCLRPDHPAIGVSYNNLALALKALGQLEEALGAQRMAMVIVEQVLPPDHPNIAAGHNNIGTILQNLERYEEALEHQRKALAIVEKAYPSVHPHVATSHHNLGIVLRLMGRYEEALEHHRKALEIRERLYPPFHRNIGVSHRHLGYVLRALGRHDEAEHHFLRMNRGPRR